MTGHDGGSFRIEPKWREVLQYDEGDRVFAFDCGWGVSPPVVYVPSTALWDTVVPEWLRGRRDVVVARLQKYSNHVVEDTDTW